MWNAVKEYTSALGRVGTVVELVSAILGISGPFYLPVFIWPILIFIAICLPFLAFNKVRVERDKLLDLKPSIQVNTEKDEAGFYIKVHNDGECAKFNADVELLGEQISYAFPRRYRACWEKTQRPETNIMKGQDDRLEIASLQLSVSPLPNMCLRLYYWSTGYFEVTPYERMHWVDSHPPWIPEVKESKKPHFTLRVTISSDPSMKEGAVTRTYELTVDGLSEVLSLVRTIEG